MQISLVIPVKNEEESLSALISSIRQQTRPPDEIILVDGGSTDQTVNIARKLIAGDSRFRVVEAGDATPGKGRNIGITAARHEWIALTDAGISLEPTWLERLIEVVERDASTDVVYGNYEPVISSFFERCAALSYATPKQQRPGGWIRAPFIASSLMRRDVWKSVGGFPDLRAAEDMIFVERIRQHGFNVGWAPAATVWWQMQPSLGRTFRRFVVFSRYNVWAGWQRYWHYSVARNYLVGLFFVVLALTHSLWWLGVLLLASLARVARSIWERREGRGVIWLLNPIQFVTVGVILLTIDAATFIGWVQAIAVRSKYQ